MSLKLKGVVTSGVGRGAKFINMSEYKKIFASLGMPNPFPGTLNVIIVNGLLYKEIVNICRPRLYVSKVEAGTKVFGGVIIWEGTLSKNQKEVPVLILRPLLSKHKENILEIISPLYLREYFNLRDGDYVNLYINCY